MTTDRPPDSAPPAEAGGRRVHRTYGPRRVAVDALTLARDIIDYHLDRLGSPHNPEQHAHVWTSLALDLDAIGDLVDDVRTIAAERHRALTTGDDDR